MAQLKKSGVSLVAENYQTYMNQMRQIQKAHKQAFSADTFKDYNKATKQFTKSSKEMKKSADDTWDMVQGLRTQFRETAKETTAAASGVSKMGGAFQNAAGGLKNLFSGITGLIGKLGILAAAISAVMAIVNFGKASVEVAARNETLKVSLDTLSASYGYTQEQADYATETLKQQGITTSAARQSLIRMTRANIEWGEASKLAAIAQGAAVVSGMNSSAAFERLVLGIQKMEPELLDELGITLRRTEAYEKFAQTLGVSAKSLTDQQKQQAILNEIYSQSEAVLGVYDAAMETAGKQQGSLARHIEETQAQLGAMLLPLKAISIALQTEFWKGLRQVTKGLATFGPVLKRVIDELQLLRAESQFPPDVKEGYREMADALRDMGMSGRQSREAAQELIGQISKGAGQEEILQALAQGFMATGDSAADAQKKASDALKLMNADIAEVTESAKAMGEIDTYWVTMGKKAQEVGRTIVLIAAMIAAAWTALRATLKHTAEEISSVMEGMAETFNLFTSGDFAGAAKVAKETFGEMTESATDFGEDFQKAMDHTLPQAFDAVQQMFPELFMDFDELGEVAETGLDRGTDAVEEQTVALEDLEAALAQLEGKYDALKKIEDIQADYNKRMEEAEEQHNKAMADEQKRYSKAIANENKKHQRNLVKAAKKKNDAIAKADRDYNNNRSKVLADAARQEKEAEKNHNRDMLNERQRFLLEQLQATRRFKVQDRRLRSEGDILALMDLREDFKLQQQEAKENFELGQKEEKTAFQDERTQRKMDTQARLDELKTELDERKLEINNAYKDELDDLHQAHSDQLASIEENHQERMVQLEEQYAERKEKIREQRDEQLKELGEAMHEEGKVTEEGMKEIADIIDQVFGEEGAGDKLIQGWSERSQSEIAGMVDETKNQIAELEAVIEAAENGGGAPASSVPGIPGLPGYVPSTGPPNLPMRQGGVGVVTGPATFSVEPGQREAFMFQPLAAGASSLDVNMRGGFDIKGGEVAGKAAVEQSLDMMTEEFRQAVIRMARRGS